MGSLVALAIVAGLLILVVTAKKAVARRAYVVHWTLTRQRSERLRTFSSRSAAAPLIKQLNQVGIKPSAGWASRRELNLLKGRVAGVR